MKKRKTQTIAAPHREVARSESEPFLAMIERVASDPNADVTKLERLLAMRNEEFKRVASDQYSAAMVDAQEGMVPVRKNIKADRFKYASLEAVDNVMRPIYSRYGFSLSYNCEPIAGDDKRLLIICDVMHRGGHTRRYSIPITVSITGPKGAPIMTQTQGEGAAVSFGRRYLLLMIFNIITAEDNAAMDPDSAVKISDAQLLELRELLQQRPPINESSFCHYIEVDQLINLPASKFTEAKEALLEKRREMAKA